MPHYHNCSECGGLVTQFGPADTANQCILCAGEEIGLFSPLVGALCPACSELEKKGRPEFDRVLARMEELLEDLKKKGN